ncbi:MAG TPA: endonuclease/exonuclease/phosphatase family protein [Patescibacteria group bacterium]|nr:endonuclease/exonuclease/phosphatase family protein [Patescibacteria group bacterium]
MPVKLVSVNIEGDKHISAVYAFIKNELPQIISLQEVFKSDLQNIADVFGMHSLFLPMSKKMVKRNNGKDQSEEIGIALLSSSPFLSHNLEYYFGTEQVSDYWDPLKVSRGVLWGTVELQQKNITVAVTHFMWTPNGETSDLQRNELPMLLNILKKSRPHVFVGDLNAARGQEIFDAIAQEYTDNIPASVQTTIDPVLHRVKNLQLVVDALFSSSEYQVSDVHVVTGISDHCAITCMVERL